MELLKIHSNGQWELVKKETNDFNSYRTRALSDKLPKDTGQRGKLHNVGNVRAPRTLSEHKMEAKVPTPIKSAQIDRNPSRSGLDT